jgi:hypothetical protein
VIPKIASLSSRLASASQMRLFGFALCPLPLPGTDPSKNGAPDTIRTCDLCLRSAAIELTGHRLGPMIGPLNERFERKTNGYDAPWSPKRGYIDGYTRK